MREQVLCSHCQGAKELLNSEFELCVCPGCYGKPIPLTHEQVVARSHQAKHALEAALIAFEQRAQSQAEAV